MTTKRERRYTLDEYLALERESEVKYEYWDGEIFAMSGGTLAHDQIMGNVFNALRERLHGLDCRLFTNNVQIKVPAAPPYRYADCKRCVRDGRSGAVQWQRSLAEPPSAL
jgi:Uma2 family endonuclease